MRAWLGRKKTGAAWKYSYWFSFCQLFAGHSLLLVMINSSLSSSVLSGLIAYCWWTILRPLLARRVTSRDGRPSLSPSPRGTLNKTISLPLNLSLLRRIDILVERESIQTLVNSPEADSHPTNPIPTALV